MKIISFNVNGIRAINRKGNLEQLIHEESPDILCLQEIKCSDDIGRTELDQKYRNTYPFIYYNTSKTRKGYSGTAILSKNKPSSVVYDLVEHDNDEGRVLTLVFPSMIIVTCYTPNSGAELARLDYRVEEWDVAFRRYINGLVTKFTKIPVIVCGDLNVAHKSIDLYNPKIKGAGYMPEERSNFDELLSEVGLVDTFRDLHPNLVKYSYWSNLGRSRSKNNGWRIDYFLISTNHIKIVKKSDILVDCLGSDHAPIVLQVDIDL